MKSHQKNSPLTKFKTLNRYNKDIHLKQSPLQNKKKEITCPKLSYIIYIIVQTLKKPTTTGLWPITILCKIARCPHAPAYTDPTKNILPLAAPYPIYFLISHLTRSFLRLAPFRLCTIPLSHRPHRRIALSLLTSPKLTMLPMLH